MKKFIETIKNIFSIEELKNRILITAFFLLIFRLGCYIVLPGLDTDKLGNQSGGFLDILNTFLGGAFFRSSIFALGIMPYISASIVVQLLTIALPYFQRMQKEGESGRRRMNQITRFLTIVITLAQSSAYIAGTIPAEAIMINRVFFTVSSMIILTAGTMFCMWMGEKITEKGIGNGTSMLIMIGIVSRFPGAMMAEVSSRGQGQLLLVVLEVIALFFVIMAVVLLTQAVRKIPVQYAKQIAGRSGSTRKPVTVGQRSFLPIKVNMAGVMPIIFAQSLMFLPPLVATPFADNSEFANSVVANFGDPTSWVYNLFFAVMIILFTFFYTAIAINPKQIAEDMQRNGGFIAGVQPGDETAEYISEIIDRITLPAALFIAAIAILPGFASMLGVNQEFANFYGGTSLLIMVGVVLDTLQQIESYLLMKEYEGLMQSGRVKGKEDDLAVA